MVVPDEAPELMRCPTRADQKYIELPVLKELGLRKPGQGSTCAISDVATIISNNRRYFGRVMTLGVFVCVTRVSADYCARVNFFSKSLTDCEMRHL